MTATVSANSIFYIGGSGGRYLDGQMDEVRVWKGVARTQQQVIDNMYTELDGTESGLFAYYKLNETTGTTADNAEGTIARDGTLVNCTFDDNSIGSVFPIYVDANVSGGDGTTWATAYSSLQDALDVAVSGNIIWVAEGTYKPSKEIDGSTDTPREFTFQMKNGVEIYGGFAGTETSVADRQIGAHETILSGDIGTVGTDTDNCYHVFYHPNGTSLDNTAILDGFTITAGYANGNIHSRGGGIYNYNSSPKVSNCIFKDNYAELGGAIFNTTSSMVIITNTIFINNSANYGGAIYNENYTNLQLTNCTFSNNSALYYAGAVENIGSGVVLTSKNCIFWGNTANQGTNEQIFNNATASYYYCDIEGSFPSGVWDTDLGTNSAGNIDVDPLFADAGGRDYRLTSLSPCADVGLDAANSETTDIRGGGRKLLKTDYTQVGTIDMGGYEYNTNLDPASPLPVELTSFTANITENSVLLNWQTATEVNNYGFEIERASNLQGQEVDQSGGNLEGYQTLGFVEGHGNSNSPNDYTFLDKSQIFGKVSYRLKQIDTDGNFEYSDVVTVSSLKLAKNELYNNYPNPFNPTTKISYSLAKDSQVSIIVYDALGQKVTELFNKKQSAGNHNAEFNASNLSSGLYFYRLETPNYSKTMKMILVK